MRVRQILVMALGLSLVPAVLVPAPAVAADPDLRGRVRAASGPVAGVCVDVHPAGTLAERVTVVTGADGRWRFDRADAPAGTFPSGRYGVQVRFRDCDGAAGSSLAGQWYPAARSMDDARVVTVDPAAASSQVLDATLAPGGTVSGRVVDDAGTAVSAACVRVTDPEDASVGNDTSATSAGAFVVAGLPAGAYVLRAADCAGPRTQASAYLGPDGEVARGVDDAARIEVTAGRSTAVGRVRLPDDGAVAGTILETGGPAANACVTALDTGSDTSVGAVTAADGSYRIAGLLPGQWLLQVTDCLQDDPARQFATVFLLTGDPDTTTHPGVAAGAPVRVGSGTTTIGARRVRPGGAVGGQVRRGGAAAGLRPADAGGPAGGACVSAVPRGSLRVVGSDVADGDGRWVIGGLDPDTGYRFAAYDCDTADGHGLDWATAAPAEGQADAHEPTAGRTSDGVTIVVGDTVRRVAGSDRVATAVQLALDTFGSADTVVLARADAYPDALAGAPLATLLDAPILLTSPGSLSPGVATAIRTLGADRVVLLGLDAALSPTVHDQVAGIEGVTDVRRVGGATRFDTAAMIAGFVGGTQAYVVEGASPDPNRGWPDAVSVAGLAARTRAPLLLVERDRVPAGTRAALEGGGFASVTAIGGAVAISDAVASELAALAGAFDRLSGPTRYATSAAVVERALQLGSWSRTTWLATGQNYPDALVAGAVIGQDGGLLQLVAGPDATASPEALATLADLADGIERTVLLGGHSAISEASAAAIRAATGDG